MVLEKLVTRIFLISFALLLVFWATALYEFPLVYDDIKQILENPRIQGWHGYRNAFLFDAWSFDEWKASSSYYRPMLALWLTTGWLLWGKSAAGFHLASLACHLGAAASLFLLGRRLSISTRALGLAVFVFVFHPISIQAVALIAAVGDPLSAVAVFGMCAAVIRADAREGDFNPADPMKALIRRLSPIGIVLGLIAALTLERAWPYLILPSAYCWFRHRSIRLSLASAFAHGSAVLLVLGVRQAVLSPHHATTTTQAGAGETLLFIPRIAARYLENLALPHHLSLAYADMPGEVIDLRWLIGLLALLVITVGMVMISRGDPRRSFLAFAALVPGSPALLALVLPYPDYVQDRYVYIPAGFASLWVANVVASGWTWWPKRRPVIGSMVPLWLITLLILFPSNATIWRDDVSLYERAVEVAPHNAKYLMNLSNALRRKDPGADGQCTLLGRASSARYPFATADELAILNYNLGNCHRGQGQLQRSLKHYADAYDASRGALHRAKHNMVVVLMELGRLDEALSQANELTTVHPNIAAAWRLRAVVLAKMQRWNDAEQSVQKSIAIDGESPPNKRLLEQILAATRSKKPN